MGLVAPYCRCTPFQASLHMLGCNLVDFTLDSLNGLLSTVLLEAWVAYVGYGLARWDMYLGFKEGLKVWKDILSR